MPFRTYMYVPEIHPFTKKEFHEREDEGHVFKVYYYFTHACVYNIMYANMMHMIQVKHVHSYTLMVTENWTKHKAGRT